MQTSGDKCFVLAWNVMYVCNVWNWTALLSADQPVAVGTFRLCCASLMINHDGDGKHICVCVCMSGDKESGLTVEVWVRRFSTNNGILTERE